MKVRSLSKSLKVLIFTLVVVAVAASSGAIAWAIAQNHFRYKAGFDVNLNGGRYVHATIEGSSYLADSGTRYETLDAVTINNNTANEELNLSFKKPITVNNDEKISKLCFEITNNSPYATMSNLVIKPTVLDVNVDNYVVFWFYSLDGSTFNAYDNEYLMIHKSDKIILELRMAAALDMLGEVNFSDNISINLYAENDLPADFEYKKAYNYEYDANLQGHRYYQKDLCATCGEVIATYELTEDVNFVKANAEYDGDDQKISDKVIYLGSSYNSTFVFSGGLENVVIWCDSPTSNITFNINVDGDNFVQYNNVVISGLSGTFSVNVTGHLTTEVDAWIKNLKFIDVAEICFELNAPYTTDRPLDPYNVLTVDGMTIVGRNSYSATNIIGMFSGIKNLVLEGFGVPMHDSVTFSYVENVTIKNCKYIVLDSAKVNLYGVSGNVYLINMHIGDTIARLDKIFEVIDANDVRIYVVNNSMYEESGIINISYSTNVVIEFLLNMFDSTSCSVKKYNGVDFESETIINIDGSI